MTNAERRVPDCPRSTCFSQWRRRGEDKYSPAGSYENQPASQPASQFGASEGIPSSATGANRAGREGTAAVTDSGASLANDAPLTHTHTRTHARTHEHADETTNTLEHKRPTAAATAPPTPKFRIHNGRAANSPCPTDCTRPKQGRSNSISVLTFLRSFFFFCPAFIPRVFLSSSHVSCNAAADALTLQTIAKKKKKNKALRCSLPEVIPIQPANSNNARREDFTPQFVFFSLSF